MNFVVSLRYDFCFWAISWRILSTIVTVQSFSVSLKRDPASKETINTPGKHTEEQPLFKPAKYTLSKSLPFSITRYIINIVKVLICPSVGGELEKRRDRDENVSYDGMEG